MSLVLKRTKDDMPGSVPGEDYVVFSGSLRLGRIHKVVANVRAILALARWREVETPHR